MNFLCVFRSTLVDRRKVASCLGEQKGKEDSAGEHGNEVKQLLRHGKRNDISVHDCAHCARRQVDELNVQFYLAHFTSWLKKLEISIGMLFYRGDERPSCNVFEHGLSIESVGVRGLSSSYENVASCHEVCEYLINCKKQSELDNGT